jgi:nucleoside-diphosphate-sugar epimerase
LSVPRQGRSTVAPATLRLIDRGDLLAGERYIAASGVNPTVREMARAAVGATGTLAPESVEESRARLGELLADALLLDQQASGARAKQQFGWNPSRPTVLEELSAS